MVYLANCPVEVINVGQGDYFWWERVPVNNSTGEERVFIIKHDVKLKQKNLVFAMKL